jgi:hypothetical protein
MDCYIAGMHRDTFALLLTAALVALTTLAFGVTIGACKSRADTRSVEIGPDGY